MSYQVGHTLHSRIMMIGQQDDRQTSTMSRCMQTIYGILGYNGFLSHHSLKKFSAYNYRLSRIATVPRKTGVSSMQQAHTARQRRAINASQQTELGQLNPNKSQKEGSTPSLTRSTEENSALFHCQLNNRVDVPYSETSADYTVAPSNTNLGRDLSHPRRRFQSTSHPRVTANSQTAGLRPTTSRIFFCFPLRKRLSVFDETK